MIELTPIEIAIAANVGIIRRVASIQKGLVDQLHSRKSNPWQVDIEGACAEQACAKALGLHWGAGVNTFKAPDLGGNIQVRSTTSRSLIIRDRDPDEDIFVLIVGQAPRYEIVGWILGKDGKNPLWRKDANNIGRPAYFVPQDKLNPIEKINLLKGA